MPSLTVLRFLFFLSLAALGAFAPFVAARLEAAGFPGSTVGLLLAMLPLGRILASPLWAAAADRWRLAGVLLRVGTAISAAGGILLLYADTATSAAIGLFLYAAGRAPLGPIVDSITVRALADPRDYGRIRAWGSAGFLLAALVAGALPDHAAQALAATLLVLTSAACWSIPAAGEGGPAPILPALRALVAEPFLLPLLLTAALQAMTLSVYDTFFSAHVRALGHPQLLTSWAIVVGVAAEIGVMRIARPLLQRFGPSRLLLAATLASIPRWLLTGSSTHPATLVATQLLHGVSFAAFWIAGVEAMSRRAPPAIAASAQSLFAAAAYGVGALVGALCAGEVRELFGTGPLFASLSLVSVAAALSATWLLRRDP